MKILAFYLPQYHEIEENNSWWGAGFTEWTHVKNAKPLYRGHKQPQVPLDDNYYNLLDKNTVKWQTDLMHEYKIDGMVYYHYYFCGKKLLEKPAENLLEWKDLNQPFMFCWANHSWYKAVDGKKELLIEQKYGDECDWLNHMEYLIPFFKDERYLKRNNKPMFMIHECDFSQKQEMMSLFDKKCKEAGFDGIEVVETYHGNKWPNDLNEFITARSEQTNAVFFREPTVGTFINRYMNNSLLKIVVGKARRLVARNIFPGMIDKLDGDSIYKCMLSQEPKELEELNIYHGVFFNWDNTPRHKGRGYVIGEPSHMVFNEWMDYISQDEFVFVNAWNEWAEGMMLEPTKENGNKYLAWIKEWKEKIKR